MSISGRCLFAPSRCLRFVSRRDSVVVLNVTVAGLWLQLDVFCSQEMAELLRNTAVG